MGAGMRAPSCSTAACSRNQSLKVVNHVLVSSAETKGAFNTGFDTVNLQRPTEGERLGVAHQLLAALGERRDGVALRGGAQVAVESKS